MLAFFPKGPYNSSELRIRASSTTAPSRCCFPCPQSTFGRGSPWSIDFAGGVSKAINLTKQYLIETNRDLKIIVEARNLDEIKEILDCGGVYRILIDNFDYDDTRKAVRLIGDQCLTESSGGINEKTVRHYAECGVDYISSGALTHSVYNMDLSLKAL